MHAMGALGGGARRAAERNGGSDLSALFVGKGDVFCDMWTAQKIMLEGAVPPEFSTRAHQKKVLRFGCESCDGLQRSHGLVAGDNPLFFLSTALPAHRLRV